MNADKLEVMVVDDSPEWLNILGRHISGENFNVSKSEGHYDAIEQLAVRLSLRQSLPDVYLCDMLEKDKIVACVESKHGDMKDVYPVIAAEVYNYLQTKGINPEFFIACTCYSSPEDIRLAEMFGFPLFEKDDKRLDALFFDVSSFPREEALNRFRENWRLVLEGRK